MVNEAKTYYVMYNIFFSCVLISSSLFLPTAKSYFSHAYIVFVSFFPNLILAYFFF